MFWFLGHEACGWDSKLLHDQGLNPQSLHWKAKSNHWTAREILRILKKKNNTKKGFLHSALKAAPLSNMKGLLLIYLSSLPHFHLGHFVVLKSF